MLRLWVLVLSLVKSLSNGCGLIDLVVSCGFVVGGEGGDIEWVVAGHGHERWVDCFCLEKRDTHRERERDVSWREKKKGIINNK